MDEDPIIGRCLEGDGEAFEMLVNRFQPGVLSLAWGMLGNREEAEDAAQEAFVRAFKNLGDFDRGRSFRPWLYAIAVHGCLDRLKKSRLERRFRHDPALSPASGSAAGAERRIENSEVLDPLLGRLRPKERSALFLSVVEGYTSAEVASVLGCSEGSARVRIHVAKRKIRDWLKRNPHA
jgi:RNA polymerase sigma-70 factor (ECF subfamily)